MAIYLDSAQPSDAERAAALGFVVGATTNPTLVAAAGMPAEAVVMTLCGLLPGIVFHQLVGETVEAREAEAHRFAALVPGRVGIKVPTTTENLGLARRLASEGLVVGMTAIFSPAQVVLAAEAGACYVLPYVDRSTRLLGDGLALVRDMRAAADAVAGADGSSVEILAASIKSPEQAVATLLAGAHHLTLPIAVIEAMGEHVLSQATIEEFARAG
jgi:transaldolase